MAEWLSHAEATQLIINDMRSVLKAPVVHGRQQWTCYDAIVARAISPDGLLGIVATLLLVISFVVRHEYSWGALLLGIAAIGSVLSSALGAHARYVQLKFEGASSVRAACRRLEKSTRSQSASAYGRSNGGLPYHYPRDRAHTVAVFRDAGWAMLPPEAIARGDLVALAAGETTPAPVIALDWDSLHPAEIAVPLPGGAVVPDPAPISQAGLEKGKDSKPRSKSHHKVHATGTTTR